MTGRRLSVFYSFGLIVTILNQNTSNKLKKQVSLYWNPGAHIDEELCGCYFTAQYWRGPTSGFLSGFSSAFSHWAASTFYEIKGLNQTLRLDHIYVKTEQNIFSVFAFVRKLVCLLPCESHLIGWFLHSSCLEYGGLFLTFFWQHWFDPRVAWGRKTSKTCV